MPLPIRSAVAGSAILLGHAAFAALPPEWQRVREFQMALEEAAKVLEGRPIDAVERVDAARFVVRAGPCRVEVRIVHHPRRDPGPALFSALPGRPTCP